MGNFDLEDLSNDCGCSDLSNALDTEFDSLCSDSSNPNSSTIVYWSDIVNKPSCFNPCVPIAASDISGILGENHGGTGHDIYAIGDILYASASTILSRLAGVATGNVLLSGGVLTAPSWGKVGLTTHVSGQLPFANLASLPQHQILVGSASNLAAPVPMSGEASIISSGAITLVNSAVIGKVLIGYTSGIGVISATDNILQAIQKLNGNVTAISSSYVTSISGTANRITVTPTTGAAVVNISGSYIGQSSITTLGTITTGIWNGTSIANANLANSSITINGSSVSLGGSVTIAATAIGGLTSGSVIFASSTGILTQDNANFFWNITSHTLGIGAAAITSSRIHIENDAADSVFAGISILSTDADSLDLEVLTGNDDTSFIVGRRSGIGEVFTVFVDGRVYLGLEGVYKGTLRLYGEGSGRQTIQAATSGTWTWTIPNAAPAGNGYIMSATTGGVSSWIDPTTIVSAYLPLVGATYTTTTGNGLALTTSTLTSGHLVNLTSTGTGATGNSQTVLNVATSGANGTSTQATAAASFSNTHTGTSAANIAIKLTSSGGTINTALLTTAGDISFTSGEWVYAATTGLITQARTYASNDLSYTIRNNSTSGSSSLYVVNSGSAGWALTTYGSAWSQTGNLDIPSTSLMSPGITTNVWIGAHSFSIWNGISGSEVKSFEVDSSSNVNLTKAASSGTYGLTITNSTAASTALTGITISQNSRTFVTRISTNAIQVGTTSSQSWDLLVNAASVVTLGGSYAAQINGTGNITGVFNMQTTANIGQQAGTSGALSYTGITNGIVTTKVADIAGTYNWIYPITVGTSGQLLTSQAGGTTAMTWTSIASIAVSSITGTANQVIASASTGAVTLSLPQDIATTSSPTFGGLAVVKNQNATTLISIANSDVTDASSRSTFRATSGTVISELISIGTIGCFVGSQSNHPTFILSNGSPQITVATTGVVTLSSTIITAAPTGGAGAMKFGKVVAGTPIGFDPSNVYACEVDGVLKKFLIAIF